MLTTVLREHVTRAHVVDEMVCENCGRTYWASSRAAQRSLTTKRQCPDHVWTAEDGVDKKSWEKMSPLRCSNTVEGWRKLYRLVFRIREDEETPPHSKPKLRVAQR